MKNSATHLSFLALLVTLSTFLLSGCSGDSKDNELIDEQTKFAQDYRAPRDRLIFINNNNGSTRIVHSEPEVIEPSTVRIEAVFEDPQKTSFEIVEDENQLAVNAISDKDGGLLGLVGQSYVSSAEITVYLAKEHHAIEVKTDNGSVFLAGVNSDAVVSINNGSIKLESSSGDFDLSTKNGLVEIDESSGSFTVDMGNGRVNFSGSFATGSSNSFITANGGIDLKVHGELNLSLDAKTSSADSRINSSVELDTVVESGQNVRRGVIGDGSSDLYIRSGGNGVINLNTE